MARTHQELLDAIAALEKEQQKKSDKSKLDDLFVLKRWLKSCQARIALPYPATLSLTEKPDFVIAGEMDVGIEVTKLLAEQRQRAAILANKQGVGHCPTQFDFDSPKRKNPQIEDMVRKDPPGLTGWREIGSTVVLYVDKILSTVDSKAQKVIRNGQHKCEQFILVIEDHHMNSNQSRAELNKLLGPKMEQHFAERHSFDEVWFTSLINLDDALLWKRNSQP